MATLTIRQLPDDTKARLRQRAARAGRSMKAEARAILVAAAAADEATVTPETLQRLVDALYAGARPTNVVGELIAEHRRSAGEE
jgi:plasmid stability protein